jgi:hypothetical protein
MATVARCASTWRRSASSLACAALKAVRAWSSSCAEAMPCRPRSSVRVKVSRAASTSAAAALTCASVAASVDSACAIWSVVWRCWKRSPACDSRTCDDRPAAFCA